MKICIVVDDYMPYSIKVGAKMMHELACELVSQEHEVSVITPNAQQKEKVVSSAFDNVTVHTFKSGEIKNVSKVKRAINESLLSFYAWRYTKEVLKNNPHNLIIYYSPTIFFGPFIGKLKKLWGAKTYLVLRDFFPQWTIDNGMLSKNSPITKYFQFFEKINYNAADTIGVMSAKNLEWFQSYYKTNIPLEVLYNWANVGAVSSNGNKYKKMLGIEDKIVYFYGGNLGHAQDMMNIVRLAKNMKSEKKAYFVLVGSGDEYSLIEKAIKEEKMKNVSLLASVNQEEFKQMLAEFDVGLFTLNKNHKTHNFPGKLLGYMVQELPILGSINAGNDLQNIIEQYKAGFISINGEDQFFYENAKKLLDETLRLQIGQNGKKLLADKFSVENAVNQLIKR